MPLDPSIILGGRPAPIAPAPSPFEMAKTLSTIEDVRAQVEQRRLAADKARQDAADRAAMQQALVETNGDVQAALPKLFQTNPTAAAALRQKFEEGTKEQAAAALSKFQLTQHQLDTSLKLLQGRTPENWPVLRSAMVGISPQADKLLPQDYNEDALNAVEKMGLTAAENNKVKTDALEHYLKGDYHGAVSRVIGAINPAAPDAQAQMDRGYAGLKPFIPQSVLDQYPTVATPDAIAQAQQLGISPEKREEHAIQRATQAQTAAHQAVEEAQGAGRLTVEQQRVALERQRLAQSAGDVTTLSPAGLDAAATLFAKTGQLPALGMGDKNTRKQIINRAADLMPGLDIASAKADYGANKDSLQAMQKQRDAIGAFEQTARKNIDTFLAQAGKVVDTGSPLANRFVRQVSGQLLGSPDQAAFDAARQVAVNEVAKIVSNPTLSGTLSDSARHEVEAFNPATATLAQSVRVMRLLKQDMDNRTGALDDAIAGIRSRISKGAPGAAGTTTTSPPRQYYDANGNPIQR